MSLDEARRVIDAEMVTLAAVRDSVGGDFTAALDCIMQCRGRVVVTGVGKSGLVGRLLASTFSSCGTPALFLHAAEGAHGDVGAIMAEDVVLAISNSGQSDELVAILPSLKKIGAKLIAMVGKRDCTLAKDADVVLEVCVGEEACPLGLAPTSSTTAQKALGDALAMSLLKRKGFTEENYALFHPGGSLGNKLLMRVEDLMHQGADNPVLDENASMETVMDKLSETRLGAVSLVDDAGQLAGIISDGDLKRGIRQYKEKFLDLLARDFMVRTPTTIKAGKLAAEAFNKMENRPSQIYVLPVVDDDNKPVGMLRMHDLVRAGIY
jgi:arabinose-5-phosphate isomerase